MSSRRRLLIAAVSLLAASLLAAACVVVVHLVTEPTPAQQRAAAAARARARLVRLERHDVRAAERLIAPPLPKVDGQPAPSGSTGLFKAPLAPHAVVGFVPYWTLSDLTAADYASVSTMCYFGPTLQRDATFAETDPDWNTASFTDFVSRANAAHDRVLLTISTTDNAVIDDVLSDPDGSARRLAAQSAATLAARGLDGVDLDIEGTDAHEREPLVRFVTDFRSDLDAARPGAEVIVDTYVASAGEPRGFFDVKGLAKAANSLFVMGYDMEDGDEPSANAPLYARDLGLSYVQALIAYTKLAPASKLVLGMPFYGDEFATSAKKGAAAAPLALTYEAIVAGGHAPRWDPVSLTPYTSFSQKGASYVVFYDNPVSLALKSALAQVFHLGGVGVWALGMEGGDPTMLEALTGNAAPLRALPSS